MLQVRGKCACGKWNDVEYAGASFICTACDRVHPSDFAFEAWERETGRDWPPEAIEEAGKEE